MSSLEALRRFFGKEPVVEDLHPEFREVEAVIDEVLAQSAIKQEETPLAYHGGGFSFGHHGNTYFFEEMASYPYQNYKYRLSSAYVMGADGQRVHEPARFAIINMKTNSEVVLRDIEAQAARDLIPPLIKRAKESVSRFKK